MKKTMLALLGLLLVIGAAYPIFANYDGTQITFYIYKKKAKPCKDPSLCNESEEAPQGIRVKNHSPNRYRCSGNLKVKVTTGDNTITETIRIDEFVNPYMKAFQLRKYEPGQTLSDLDANHIDCAMI